MANPLLSFILFTFLTTTTARPQELHAHLRAQQAILQLILPDTISSLSDMGFSGTAGAMEENFTELATFNNLTVFALDDEAISNGYQGYMGRVRYHVVPDHFLRKADLDRLPVSAMLPTLERGQSLEVTSQGVGMAPFKINCVELKLPNMIRNSKIVVHSLYEPFQSINPTAERPCAAP